MNRKMVSYILLAFLPVVLLGALFPEKLTTKPDFSGHYFSHPDPNVVVFVREGCPHCADFEKYAMQQEWRIKYYEVTTANGYQLFQDVQQRAPALNQGTPTIVLNGEVFQGYETDETSGKLFDQKIAECEELGDDCLSFEEFIASDAEVDVQSVAGVCAEDCELDTSKYVLNLWFIGEVDLTLLSLPALALLLGFLDGFNPCAMWVLITLLTLLINTHDMKKLWIVAGTFLFISGAVYYMFIAAWLNVFLIIGYNMWVQKVIGLVAIGAGGFYLYEAFGEDPNACHVTSARQRQKVIERMKRVMEISAWPLMILGVAILAVSVNMIELVCTAGLPAVFTQILAFNNVTLAAKYFYIFLFILMYMIDDTIIFAIAIYTMRATGMTTKYRRFTLIFGGGLMYTLGMLLMFFPDALTF